MKKPLKITFTLIFTIILLLGFAVPLNPPNGTWYQQFMSNIGSRSISDIFFIDSLTGYAVTNNLSPNDTGYILKTNNGGNNWNINLTLNRNLTTVKFINSNTGFVCGGSGGGAAYLYKTTNSGTNWNIIPTPGATSWRGLSLIDENTIWLVDNDSFVGGVFFTSNGGLNWQNQFSSGNQNPNKIYMYNASIGFMSNSSALPNIYKTTNGGVNWNMNVNGEWFNDIQFVDSITGWRCMPSFDTATWVKKTTDGGITWIKQILPTGGTINLSQIVKFSFLNKDTIYGVGGQVNYGGSRYRGIIYKTINGGNNWLFQVPDTTFGIFAFGYIQFISRSTGWVYNTTRGIHTTNGGDTTFLVGLQQISIQVPKDFKLFQNYPNPFNPKTNIKYSVMSKVKGQMSNIKLSIYEITGKEITVLVNQKQNAGTYEVDWNATGYSSGIYFYKITVVNRKEVFSETKKMLMIK